MDAILGEAQGLGFNHGLTEIELQVQLPSYHSMRESAQQAHFDSHWDRVNANHWIEVTLLSNVSTSLMVTHRLC